MKLRIGRTKVIVFLLMAALSGCAVLGKFPVNFKQAGKLGFNKTKIIQLGQLVNVAYQIFDEQRAAKENHPSPAFPEPFLTGFTPLVNLQGVDNVHHVTKEFYGHVARLDSAPTTVVVSIRGTSDVQEWIDDAKTKLVNYSDNAEFGRVELGFKQIFQSLTIATPNSTEFTPLDDYLVALENVDRIIVVGHSLGSSVATLVAFDSKQAKIASKVQLLTFASPRTGDFEFVEAFQKQIKDSVRVVNEPDLVPRVPLRLMHYRHIWHELKIDSKDDHDIAHSVVCFHSLLTYLHMLDNDIKPVKSCVAN